MIKMAEMAIWDGEGQESGSEGSGTRRLLVAILERLRARWKKVRGGALEDGDRVHEALEQLVETMDAGGSQGDEAAAEFGRMGGHSFLLDVLDKDTSEEEADAAARAVDLCMSLCDRFPMKGASIAADQKDVLRVSIGIDGPANRTGTPVTMHLRRR